MATTTSKKPAAKKVVNQGAFVTALNRKGDDVIDARVTRLLKAAKGSHETLVKKLDNEVDQLIDKQERMLDQSPDNRYSLQIGKDFDADTFTKEYQELSVQLANKKVEYQIAKENYEFLYGK